jgi:hypothetical protein
MRRPGGKGGISRMGGPLLRCRCAFSVEKGGVGYWARWDRGGVRGLVDSVLGRRLDGRLQGAFGVGAVVETR